MNNILQKDKEFKEAIGEFMIEFSQLEYGLVILCTLTEFDLRKKDRYYIKYLGLSFEQKVKAISEFIDENMLELKPIWDEIKQKIGTVNRERRFLAHGIHTYYYPVESISTFIKEKGSISEKKQTVPEIKKLISILQHLNTGKNGINGEFYLLFTKTRINQWNKLVTDEHKIVYTVNSEIISDYKGNK